MGAWTSKDLLPRSRITSSSGERPGGSRLIRCRFSKFEKSPRWSSSARTDRGVRAARSISISTRCPRDSFGTPKIRKRAVTLLYCAAFEDLVCLTCRCYRMLTFFIRSCQSLQYRLYKAMNLPMRNHYLIPRVCDSFWKRHGDSAARSADNSVDMTRLDVYNNELSYQS